MKKHIILILFCAASAALAQTNAPVVVAAPTATPSTTELISLLGNAVAGVVAFITGLLAILTKLKLNKKANALSTIINAVETFKVKEDPQMNADLKAHVKEISKEDGTQMLVRKEVIQETAPTKTA